MVGYRFGTWGAPRNLNAAQLVAYEIEELGNEIEVLVVPETLAAIQAKRCRWVTKTKKEAKEYRHYGPPETVQIAQVLAADPFGGFLVEIQN